MSRLLPLLTILFLIFLPGVGKTQMFSAPRILHQHVTNLVAGKIVLADLDGDLRQDILISGSDPNVGWFEQQANGNFSSLLPIYDEEIFGEAVDATDLDGDGDIDIVAATSFGTGLVWIENLGGNEFATAQIITSIDYPIDDMELVDLNQDGMKDILVSSYSATDQLGTVHWLQNLGGGSFGFPNIVTTSAREVKKLETADLNGDGLVDIVLASYWDYRMVWHANLGGGLFSSAQFIRPVNDSILNHGVVALDIDLDGDMDIVNTRASKPLITWLENDGLGHFIAEHTIWHEDGGWDIATGDFNLDGYPDVVTGLGLADQTVIFYNTGQRSFTAPVIIAQGQSVPNDVFVADLDFDHDPEIFIATTLDKRYMYFENFRIDCTPIVSTEESILCADDTIYLGALQISDPGTYVYATPNPGQCDSIHITHVWPSPEYLISLSDTLMDGESYTLPDGEIVSEPGEYIFVFPTIAGCDSTIIVQLLPDPFTSANFPSSEVVISVSPNPTIGSITIRTNAKSIGSQWCLIDAFGRICSSGRIAHEAHQVDMQDMPSGVYSLMMIDQGSAMRNSVKIIRM